MRHAGAMTTGGCGSRGRTTRFGSVTIERKSDNTWRRKQPNGTRLTVT